ncbi:MAG: peroxiredoxin [Pseudomonadota bacterium]
MKIGDTAPDFHAETTMGPLNFYEWVGDAWAMLFSHPKDFTPVCTTEMGAVNRLMPEFKARGVKVIGLSVDSLDRHLAWMTDIETTQKVSMSFPLIADDDLAVARAYGMISGPACGSGFRTAMDNQTVRNVFVIGPDKRIRFTIQYPMSTGRDFTEILRAIDSVQLTAEHKVATPADWRQGEDVIILPSIDDQTAREMFPAGWSAPTSYLRVVPQPA